MTDTVIDVQYEYVREPWEKPGYLLWKFIVMRFAGSDLVWCSKVYESTNFTMRWLLSVASILITTAVFLQLTCIVSLVFR